MVNYIWITTQKELIHKYPAAPDDVSFLKSEHRHLFKFKIWLEVFGDDRDVEFIIFKRYVDGLLNDMEKNLGVLSCEMISNYLAEKIKVDYSKRDIMISVSEDGENGALYSYPKNH